MLRNTFPTDTPRRAIDLEANIAVLIPAAINPRYDNRFATGNRWRSLVPQYVDRQTGMLTAYQGAELDEAIASGQVITGHQWRTAFNGTQRRNIIVDELTGLPPVNPSGELITITQDVSRPKRICGEWISLHTYLSSQRTSEYQYIDSQTRMISELQGSALLDALKARTVIARMVDKVRVKPTPGKRTVSESDVALGDNEKNSKKIFLTPQLSRLQESESTSSVNSIASDPDAYMYLPDFCIYATTTSPIITTPVPVPVDENNKDIFDELPPLFDLDEMSFSPMN